MTFSALLSAELFSALAASSPAGGDSPGLSERALWHATILQALLDATSGSKKSEAIKAKREARQWLRGDSGDFLEVCDHAGLDPQWLKPRISAALARNCRWRNDPSPAPRPTTPPAPLPPRPLSWEARMLIAARNAPPERKSWSPMHCVAGGNH